MAKIPSLPSPHSDYGGHSVGNGHGEPGPGPQGGASGPRGRVPEAKGRSTERGRGVSGPRCRSEGKEGREVSETSLPSFLLTPTTGAAR